MLKYNAIGLLIKTLNLDYNRVGNYQTQWDGKNEVGECVRSGVYFYTIEAGSFSATRKMVVIE